MVPAPVARQDLGSSRAGTRCQPGCPDTAPNTPVGCSESPCWWHDDLGGNKASSHSKCSPQSWEMHVSPKGCGRTQGREQEGDRQQERAGSTALASSPSLGEERKGFAGIPSPCSKRSRAHSLSACPSAAAAVSHLTFSSLLSRAGSCSPSHGSATATRGKDTKPPPPSPGCQPAWEHSPFWGKRLE